LLKNHPRTKHEVDRMTRCWVMAIWSFSHSVLLETTAWLLLDIGDRRPDTKIGHHAQVILYSVQCCDAAHWTDNNASDP